MNSRIGPRRALRTVAIAIGLAFVTVTTAAAAPAKAPRVTRDKPCTMLTTKQVAKAFGNPTAEGVEQSVVLSCTWLVGTDPNALPGGSFATQQLFPSILNTTHSAKGAIEDSHAIDLLAEDDLHDVDGVGRSAYMNSTRGRLNVQATKKFAFIVVWSPASKEGPIGKKNEKKLIRLAKDIVKRAPK